MKNYQQAYYIDLQQGISIIKPRSGGFTMFYITILHNSGNGSGGGSFTLFSYYPLSTAAGVLLVVAALLSSLAGQWLYFSPLSRGSGSTTILSQSSLARQWLYYYPLSTAGVLMVSAALLSSRATVALLLSSLDSSGSTTLLSRQQWWWQRQWLYYYPLSTAAGVLMVAAALLSSLAGQWLYYSPLLRGSGSTTILSQQQEC